MNMTSDERESAKLTRLRREIEKGFEQSARGESKPLNIEAIKADGRRRLAEMRAKNDCIPNA